MPEVSNRGFLKIRSFRSTTRTLRLVRLPGSVVRGDQGRSAPGDSGVLLRPKQILRILGKRRHRGSLAITLIVRLRRACSGQGRCEPGPSSRARCSAGGPPEPLPKSADDDALEGQDQPVEPDPQRERLDQELFDGIADSYARKDVIASTRLARAAIIRRAVRPVLDEAGTLGTVVDVGCGVGAQALHLRGTFERYLGIDYSSRLIEIGRTLLAGERNCELVAANIKSTELPSNAADTILVVGALHHMTDIPEVMAALKRIARPGLGWWPSSRSARIPPFRRCDGFEAASTEVTAPSSTSSRSPR